MQAGRLDRIIDIERKSVTLDQYGDPIETWSALVENRPAAYHPLSGDERFLAEQVIAKEQVEFRIRLSNSVADVSPLDRVVYPAGSTDARDIYDIIDVSPIGWREGLSVFAVRRPEVPITIIEERPLLTEDGQPILTEDGQVITTEG